MTSKNRRKSLNSFLHDSGADPDLFNDFQMTILENVLPTSNYFSGDGELA